MKNLLIAPLPALALLALGGCATSGALVNTTESDGVYYSSADKTTATGGLNSVYANRSAVGSPNPDGYAYGASGTTAAAPATTDDANPDYQGGTQSDDTSTLGASSDYYANGLTNGGYNSSGFGQTYTGPGVSSFNYSPAYSSSVAYGSPFGYGLGLGLGYGGFGYPYGGFYSPYAYSGFYDPFYSSFYSPFYSPWGYGYGSGLSIGFGYGFGSYYGFGSPYGYGGYGYGGYGYGGGYYGRGYTNYRSLQPGYYSNDAGGGVMVGRRGSRGGMVMSPQTNGMAAGGSAPVNIGSGRRGGGYVLDASGNGVAPTTGQRTAAQPGTADASMPQGGRGWRAMNSGAVGQPSSAAPGATAGAPAGMPAGTGGGRRGGFFNGFFGNGGGAPGGSQRSSGMSQGQAGGYTPQPRSYNPQPSRSFEPQRSFSQPSFSQPSRGGSFGGGGGGGSFGGGGGGGGRRGGR